MLQGGREGGREKERSYHGARGMLKLWHEINEFIRDDHISIHSVD